ncbi:MAG: NAD(P)H-dependent oxidoreductase [Chthoniobacterales bacterium]
MDVIKLPLLLGSVRAGRRSEHVARYLLATLEADSRFHPELLDLATYRFGVLEQRPSDMADPPEGLEVFSQQLREADALLIVSPEYKGGIPGALKNAIDLLEPEILRRKPVGICTVSAGGFGGLQCLLQLRLTVLALGGVPIPESIAVSRVQERFGEQGGMRNGSKALETERFLGELYFYARALKRARQTTPLLAERP